MKPGIWKIVSALTVVCMAVAAIASAALGGCGCTLECTTGDVPMKCHWTFVADTFVAIIGVVSAFASTFAKGAEARRMTAAATLVVCIVCAILPTDFGIGVCANAEMACNTTAYIVWIAAAVAAVLSIVQLVKADPAEAGKPKMQL